MPKVCLTFLAFACLLVAQSSYRSYQEESNAWHNAHPFPSQSGSEEDRQAYYQHRVEAARVWVQHWPDSVQARLQLLDSLGRLKSSSNQELEEAGESVLKVAQEHPQKGFRFKPVKTDVVAVWLQRKLRLEQCLQLSQEAAREDLQAQSDNPSAAKLYLTVVAQGMFETLSLEVYVALDLKKVDYAESAVQQMKQYLDHNPEVRPRFEPRYLATAATVAEAQGHKPDALVLDSQAFRESPEDYSNARDHALEIWKQMGGSDEGFNAWINTFPAAQQHASANTSYPWNAINKPLTDFHGTDNSGRKWSVEDFQGKTSLISVWESGCAPCFAELPKVQNLFDELKEHKDLQVLTINLDSSLAPLVPFIEKRNYNFPIVLVPSGDVDKMVGVGGVPRTWIVDSKGTVRFELIGYDASMWPEKIRQQLSAVK